MLSDRDFFNLLEYLNRPWAGFRKVRKGVKKRVRRHMAELECSTVEQYVMRLSKQPHARAGCEACLRVTISRFFRDRQLWQALKARILPDLVRRFSSSLRIWSVGCACGEEAYSMAMVWSELNYPLNLHLVATDVGSDCLQRARAGIYGRSNLREVPDELRTRYFETRKGGKQFIVRTHLLPPIQWQVHDLLGQPPEENPFHLILLRNNLLTYYRGAELQAAFTRILSCLAPGGCLAIGAHEHLPRSNYPLIQDTGCPWIFWLRTERPPVNGS